MLNKHEVHIGSTLNGGTRKRFLIKTSEIQNK